MQFSPNTLLTKRTLTTLKSSFLTTIRTNNREKTNRALREMRGLLSVCVCTKKRYHNGDNWYGLTASSEEDLIKEKYDTSTSIMNSPQPSYYSNLNNEDDEQVLRVNTVGERELDGRPPQIFQYSQEIDEIDILQRTNEIDIPQEIQETDTSQETDEMDMLNRNINLSAVSLNKLNIDPGENIFKSVSLSNLSLDLPSGLNLKDPYSVIEYNRLIIISDGQILVQLIDLLDYLYCQYNVLIILWQISFTAQAHRYFNKIVNKLIDIVKREKDSISKLRLCFFIMVNLLKMNKQDNSTCYGANACLEQDSNLGHSFFISTVKCSELLKEINKLEELRNYISGKKSHCSATNSSSQNKEHLNKSVISDRKLGLNSTIPNPSNKTLENNEIVTIKSVKDSFYQSNIDEEFIKAISTVKNLLEGRITRTGSFTNYLRELFSGVLEKSPYHFNDAFFCVNTLKIYDLRNSIIRALLKYLKYGNVQDKLIAVYDLYHIARNIPLTIGVMERNGIKKELIRLCAIDEFSNTELRVGVLKCLAVVIHKQVISSD